MASDQLTRWDVGKMGLAIHDCTNCGNIFLANDHLPKHMETLHVVFVLPVSCVATPRGADITDKNCTS